MLTAGGHMNLWNKDLYTTEGIGIGHCHNCDNSGNPSINIDNFDIKVRPVKMLQELSWFFGKTIFSLLIKYKITKPQ